MTINNFSEKSSIFEFVKSFIIDLFVIMIIVFGIHIMCIFIAWLYNILPLDLTSENKELITPYLSINLTRTVVTITDLVSIAMICVIGITKVLKFTWIYVESCAIYWRFICERCKKNDFS